MTVNEKEVSEVVRVAWKRREEDEDIAIFIDKYGFDMLESAVEYTFEREAGKMNHRIMARELGLSPLEAEVILQALGSIVRDIQDE